MTAAVLLALAEKEKGAVGMKAIQGRPEGRPGVWLISAETACELIDALPGDEVHNYINGGGLFVGADWPKAGAKELASRAGVLVGLVFAPIPFFGHQLVVIGERRWAFDVGAIEEERMSSADDDRKAEAGT